uniref:HAT C-terminal dimerisation domain-containing protein n=1 Tax=Peronospora matthiolae TaxID=2874970 RepID=A0AAV1UR70_9STRA
MSTTARDSLDAPRRPRGRPPNRSWAFFTSVTEPQKLPSAVCRHCNQLVHHRHKWGQARTHLMKCPQFLNLMDTLPANEMPEWYLAEASRRHHLLSQSNLATFTNHGIPNYQVLQDYHPTPPLSALKGRHALSVTGAAPVPIIMENRANIAVQIPIERDIKEVEENLAMHLFTTTAVEKIVDGTAKLSFLESALQAWSQDFVLPNRAKLLTELLNCCFNNVKKRVADFFQSGSMVPATLLLDVTTPPGVKKDPVVHYMTSLASFEKYPMYLESVVAPSSEKKQDDVEWRTKDVARMVEKLSHPVAGCVMACSSPESQRLRGLLAKRFPGMYFHGCMRDALWSFICHIFAGRRTTEDDGSSIPMSFVQEIQEFALQCKDLAFFLPPLSDELCLSEAVESSKSVIHVSLTRRLSVAEAFFAILQAECFLDTDSVSNQNSSAGSHGPCSDGLSFAPNRANVDHLQTELIEVVQSPRFTQKVRKFLAVLRPVHTLLKSLDGGTSATSLLLSEVQSCFSRLAHQYASSTQLLPGEKNALQALVRQQQENVVGPAHLLALLLDPVLLGENLPADAKADVEQKLMSSLRADGTCLSDVDKNALHAQYMDFKQFARNLKTSRTETLGFRSLKERRLSPLQFWFADGSKWPVLQSIACRVFVMPVCTVSASRVFSEADVALRYLWNEADSFSASQLAYVRVNTHQLDLAEMVGSSLMAEPQNVSNTNDITASMVV